MAKKKWQRDSLLVFLSLVIWTSCQTASSRETLPVSARSLGEEFEASRSAMRDKYDGKEVTVSGCAVTAPRTPPDRDNEGWVLLAEKDVKQQRPVACWFSKSQFESFSQVKAGQCLTVKGVFNGESGVELKFCKLVKIG